MHATQRDLSDKGADFRGSHRGTEQGRNLEKHPAKHICMGNLGKHSGMDRGHTDSVAGVLFSIQKRIAQKSGDLVLWMICGQNSRGKLGFHIEGINVVR